VKGLVVGVGVNGYFQITHFIRHRPLAIDFLELSTSEIQLVGRDGFHLMYLLVDISINPIPLVDDPFKTVDSLIVFFIELRIHLIYELIDVLGSLTHQPASLS